MGQLPVLGTKIDMLKVVIFSALVAVTVSAPAGPPAYGPPPPAPYHAPVPVEKLPPQPFAYQYGVKDDYSGASFDKSESQDPNGVVQGEYRVALPDGRTQIVTYSADHAGGFIADVKYEGTAVYPPAPAGGYGPAPAPKYAPAPPKYAPAPVYKPAKA